MKTEENFIVKDFNFYWSNNMKIEDNLDNMHAIYNIANSTAVISDLITCFCGEHISNGTYRSVYNYNLDDNYVIKLEEGNSFCNIIEYMIWDEVKELTIDRDWETGY